MCVRLGHVAGPFHKSLLRIGTLEKKEQKFHGGAVKSFADLDRPGIHLYSNLEYRNLKRGEHALSLP